MLYRAGEYDGAIAVSMQPPCFNNVADQFWPVVSRGKCFGIKVPGASNLQIADCRRRRSVHFRFDQMARGDQIIGIRSDNQCVEHISQTAAIKSKRSGGESDEGAVWILASRLLVLSGHGVVRFVDDDQPPPRLRTADRGLHAGGEDLPAGIAGTPAHQNASMYAQPGQFLAGLFDQLSTMRKPERGQVHLMYEHGTHKALAGPGGSDNQRMLAGSDCIGCQMDGIGLVIARCHAASDSALP